MTLTISDLEQLETNFFDIKTLAVFFNINEHSLRVQAKQHPETLGFPCCCIGTRVKFPKDGFINWFKGNQTRNTESR